MARRILGLDLGSHSVKAVELRQSLRGLEVVQLRSLALDDPAPALTSELQGFVQLYDLPSEHVVASLPGDRVTTRRLRFPFRDRRKLAAAVPFEIEDEVPFSLEDYFLDWELVGDARDGAEVAATLAPRADVALLVETLREAGLDPKVVEAEGLALGNLASLFGLGGVRLLADVGHRKTVLCLVVDGRPIAARSIPVAGRAFTEAIRAERGVGEIEAERIKMEEGIFGAGGRPASPGAVAAADRLAREILRTLGSLEAALEGRLPEQIDLVGGSARLHRLDEFLRERTGIPTTRLSLPEGELASAFVAAGDPLLFGPAAALALRASARAATHMNFRQDELARRIDLRRMGRELRWSGFLAAALALLALVSVGTQIALQRRRAEALDAQAQALYAQAFPGRPVPSNPLASMQQALRAAERKADTLGVYRGNLSALDILTEISRRVPANLDVVFEELSIDRQVIQIKGHSPSFGSVDRLRAELAKYPPFSDITVGDITSDSRRGGQNFSVRISLADEGTGS